MELIKSKLQISRRGLTKFLLATGFSVFFMFISLTPEGFNPLISILANWVLEHAHVYLKPIIFFTVSILGIGTILTSIFKPDFVHRSEVLSLFFKKSPFETAVRILAIIIAGMITFSIGPTFLSDQKIGGSAMDIVGYVSVWMILFTIIFPLFLDFGIDKFLGILFQPLMKPLFCVPGLASMSAALALIMGPTMGAVLAREHHEEGYYSDRETSIVMTTLIGPHIPAILFYSSLLNIENYFPQFMICSILTVIICGIIVTRIPPLSKIPENYISEKKDLSSIVPEGKNRFTYAIEEASEKAKDAKITFKQSSVMIFDVLAILAPYVLVLGTIAFILVHLTPVFDWISYPMGYYLKLLGVENAFQIAPATVIGLVEGMLPAIIATGFETVKHRFIIGVLGTVQLIFFTELAIVILTSKASIKAHHLVVLFFERTIIALPVIVLFANIVF